MKNFFEKYIQTANCPLLTSHCLLPIAYCLLFITCCQLSSCGKKQPAVEDNVFYTCSMDPQVMERHPGRCPICKMELTKILMTKEDMESKSIKLSEEQMVLGNIKIDSVKVSTIGEEKIITATTTINETNTNTISSRMAGRIENIYFKSVGDNVYKGQKLYDIYSEELLSAQQEYLLSIKKKEQLIKGGNFDYDSFINAAKNKLVLYGLTDEQIEELANIQLVQPTISIYSQHSGIIIGINTQIGNYLMEGMPILRIADLKSLWVEAQLYSNELNLLSHSDEVDVTIASFPDKIIKGKLNFVNLELVQNSKINLVRIEIENPDTLLRPGMMAYVTLKLNTKKGISLPADAVIRNKKHAIAWVQNADGSFEARMVKLGMETKNKVEIASGLILGERVVISGTYLLNSEYIFKKGADPMAGMHEHMDM